VLTTIYSDVRAQAAVDREEKKEFDRIEKEKIQEGIRLAAEQRIRTAQSRLEDAGELYHDEGHQARGASGGAKMNRRKSVTVAAPVQVCVCVCMCMCLSVCVCVLEKVL
jgi:hypothetical protein